MPDRDTAKVEYRPVRGREYDELPRDDAQTLAENCRNYWIDETLYLVYRNRLWRRTGQTHNPRTMALADAVGWEGELLTVHTEGCEILLQHHMAGVEHRIHASQRTSWCFVTFEEVETFGPH